MKQALILLTLFWGWFPQVSWSQAATSTSSFQASAKLLPVEYGFRFDDNVYRVPSALGRFSDGINLLDLGGGVDFQWGLFGGNLSYKLRADQYLRFTTLNNIKNDLSLFLSVNPGPLSFYYKKEDYFRNSQYFEFDYIDDDNLLGVIWSPPGPWNYEIRYKNYSRQYDDNSDQVKSRNFVDEAVSGSLQREVDNNFSLKLEGSYNNRQFQRVAVARSGEAFVDLNSIQTDETWTILLNAHLYFESILQDINFEEQRTNSNSYGFSNTVESVSWAGVVRPASSLYLQLFFRLYFKNYDVPPLISQDLQLGFVDEDSQDLLSLRGSWEFSPQWMASIGVSRARSESEQPGQYYIKNILSAQIRKNF